MALGTQSTAFTSDNQGRYLCNTLDEALTSAGVNVGSGTPAKDARPFDVIVVGGGSFGVVFAQHLLAADATNTRRVLILERGPYIAPEHEQNLPFVGGVLPGRVEKWVSDLDTGPSTSTNRHGGFDGLQIAIGGRSLQWGGWSPELLADEMRDWPGTAVADLQGGYFEQAGDQLGTTDTNDYLYGPLHGALREALRSRAATLTNTLPFTQWPDHPRLRYKEPGASDARLRELLGLPTTDTTPRQQLLDLLKLEAPLAVQSRAEPGLFPVNKFSSVPMLTRAARRAYEFSGGQDELRRLMIVPNVQVLDLVTTPPGPNLRVTGVHVASGLNGGVIPISANGIVVVAAGTVETTRLAKLTFRGSLASGVGPKIGSNLMAHLRSNVTLRLPLACLGLSAADLAGRPLPVSALFLKGQVTLTGGQRRYFHLQITASAGGAGGGDSEALLFKKVPDLDSVESFQQATSTHVVVTLRGIGEMAAGNSSSKVDVASFDTDGPTTAAWVTFGNAKAYAENPAADPLTYQTTTPVTNETQDDATAWAAMDDWTDRVAIALANGNPFEVLVGGGVKRLPAGATVADLTNAISHTDRRDKLGTTHHEAGTMAMGSVTDDLGRLQGVPNCYFAGPCLFPTIGSPNPMLTGTALARRTADYLSGRLSSPRPEAPLLARPAPPPNDGTGWQIIFDGTTASFQRWRPVRKKNAGTTECNVQLIDGQLVSTGTGDHALIYYAATAFANFVLRVQFRIVDAQNHNGGVFVRMRRPDLDLTPTLTGRADADPNGNRWRDNRAWTAVFSGFEVQIDDNAKSNGQPTTLKKLRTGAIYEIPAGDPGESATQTYTPGPSILDGGWYEYEITVQGDVYDVRLGRADGSPKLTVSTFTNTDAARGRSNAADPDSGYVGLQTHNDGRVYYRHVRVKPL